MRLQERDKLIIEYIYKFQCLKSASISKLFFPNTLKLAQRRLRVLCKEGYLNKVPMPSIGLGGLSYLYYLGDKAASFLSVPVSKPRLTLKLSHQLINNELMINTILCLKNLKDIQFDYLTEHQFRTANHEAKTIPDGSLMLIKNNKQALVLLENDSSTEIIKSPTLNNDIETKIILYTEKFQNNDIDFFKKYFGYDFKRFRLLFITNNQQRMTSISRVIEEHDTHGFIYITTLAQFAREGIAGDIWFIPASGEVNAKIV